MKILLIEDDADLRSEMADELERRGHHVRTAGNGAMAFSIATHELLDAIVLDYYLPDASGAALLKRMREADVFAGVVVVTADSKIGQEDFTGLDIWSVMVKPIVIGELEEKLRESSEFASLAISGVMDKKLNACLERLVYLNAQFQAIHP